MKNYKALLIGVLLLALVICALTACGAPHVHDYKHTSTTATCDEAGEATYTCSCGDSYTEPEAALGHKKYVVDSEASTCEIAGWERLGCLVLGCDYSETVELPLDPDRHTFEGWECVDCSTSRGVYQYDDNLEGYVLTDVLESGTLLWAAIPSSYMDTPVVKIGDDVFRNHEHLSRVVIPDTVKAIGERAFYYCTGLTTLTVGDSVTEIGESAFYMCSDLKTVAAPALVIENLTQKSKLETVNITSGTGLPTEIFKDCTRLKTVLLADSVKVIGYDAFRGCNKLESVTCPAEALDSLTYIESIKSSLVSLTVTSGDKIADYSFDDFSALKTVVLADSITEIGTWAFKGCFELENVTIGNSVESIGDNAFQNCKKMKNITLPKTLISIGNEAFYGCETITAIVIPDKVETVGSRAFLSCPLLADVTVGAGVENSYDSWFSTPKSITVSADNAVYQSIDGNLYSKDGTTLVKYASGKNETSFTVPDSVLTIARGAFADAKIKTVSIPSSVASIGEQAFTRSALTEISLPAFVTKIEYATFSGCKELKTVLLSGTLTEIGYNAFDGTNLESVKYDGSEGDWADVTVNRGNDSLLTALEYLK